MVLDDSVIQTTGSANIDNLYKIYHFTAGSSNTNYTYTLPVVTVDGLKIKVCRNDNDHTSTLLVDTSGENIIKGNSTVNSVYVEIYSCIYFISYNGQWYIAEHSKINKTKNKVIFSGSFVDDSGNRPYHQYKAKNETYFLNAFPYSGTDKDVISSIYFGILGDSKSFTADFQVRKSDLTTIVASTGTLNINSGFQVITLNFTSSDQQNLPSGEESLSIFVALSGGSSRKLKILSFLVVA